MAIFSVKLITCDAEGCKANRQTIATESEPGVERVQFPPGWGAEEMVKIALLNGSGPSVRILCDKCRAKKSVEEVA